MVIFHHEVQEIVCPVRDMMLVEIKFLDILPCPVGTKCGLNNTIFNNIASLWDADLGGSYDHFYQHIVPTGHTLRVIPFVNVILTQPATLITCHES